MKLILKYPSVMLIAVIIS